MYQSVIVKINTHCNPKKNETYERYAFNSRKQREGEAFEQIVTDLKLKAQTCQFDTLMICERASRIGCLESTCSGTIVKRR